MMRVERAGLPLCVLLTCCCALTQAAESGNAPAKGPVNLVKNGDFEATPAGPESKGKIPTGWTASVFGSDTVEIAALARPGSRGKQSMKVNGSEKVPAGGLFSEMTAIPEGKALRLTAWIRSEAMKDTPAGLYFGIAWYDKDRKPVRTHKTGEMNYTYANWSTKEADGWFSCDKVFPQGAPGQEAYDSEIPPGAAYFCIWLFILNHPQAAWFDDVEVTAVDAAAATAVPAPAAAIPATPPAPSEWGVAWLGPKQSKDAAEIMARYLSRVLSKEVVAAEWKPPQAKRVFLVTDSRHAPESIAKKLVGARLDAFAIEYPVAVDGQNVCVLVSHDEFGCDYPVYYFLTKFMEVNWVGPGELGIVLQPKPGWSLPEKISLVENPAFEMRLWTGNAFSSREWLARGARMDFHHALGNVFHPSKHADTPEVYPLIAGKRYIPQGEGISSGGWQPCTSSPKSIEIAVQHVLDGYAKNPSLASVSLSVNDGAGNTCECELCRAQDGKGGVGADGREDLSNRFFRFYNTVIERVRQVKPDARIAVVGYGPVKNPPTEVKVAPGVEVFKVNPSVAQLQAWKECGASTSIYLWLWDGGFLTIRPDLQTIADVVRAANAQGGIGCYSEQIAQWTVSAPRFYVLAKLLWNPATEPYQALDEYLRLAYGDAAAPAVRAYFDRWEAVYRRRPADQWSNTSWGWRSAEQLQYLKYDDLTAFDKALAAARAAKLTAEQAQRLDYLATHYALMRANAEQYLATADLASAEWVRAHSAEDVLGFGERTLALTDEFNRIWNTQFATDKSGWLEDNAYSNAVMYGFISSIRAMVSSNHETALDQAMAHVTQQMTAKQPKDQVLAYWQEQIQKHPKLAMFIGPQVNAIKGVVPQDVLVNGSFEKGKPGNPPTLEAWDFYEFYGMAKGKKCETRWEAKSGHDGGRAIALGQGTFPEMKGLLAMEKDHRYTLSFWYKTENRKGNVSFSVYSYDGALAGPREIDYAKIHSYLDIALEPTDGQWRQVTRTLTPTQSGTFIIQLASYYQAAGVWTSWDDIQVRRIW